MSESRRGRSRCAAWPGKDAWSPVGQPPVPCVVTDVRKLFWYQWSILGSTMGSHEEYRAVAEQAQRGRLWPEVDSVVPLAEARRGVRTAASAPNNWAKSSSR